MSLSDHLEATHPPRSYTDLHQGTLHVGEEQAPCWVGLMSVRARRDYWPFGAMARPAPEQFTSMWTSGAEHLVDALPVRDDGMWWRASHAVPVQWRGDRGEVLSGALLLVDRPRTPSQYSLGPETYREVWLLEDWTITLPKELADAYAHTGRVLASSSSPRR